MAPGNSFQYLFYPIRLIAMRAMTLPTVYGRSFKQCEKNSVFFALLGRQAFATYATVYVPTSKAYLASAHNLPGNPPQSLHYAAAPPRRPAGSC